MRSVRVTYARRRKRGQNAKLPSSPLEVLPPDVEDLTRTQMTRRMLKRSRRVALAEQLEDKNVEHFREHLAKRIKRTQEHVSNLEVPPDADDALFQTPFPSSQSVCESAVAEPSVPEQLSPVPIVKRIASRTSSRNLKENGMLSLASPFSSRPGSAAPSPRHRGKGRSSRRSHLAKSRTLSGAFKENTRRVLRKDSTVSLGDVNRSPSTGHIKHQRYPSSPSTAYMRPRFPQEDWISLPEAFSRAFDDYDAIPSPSSASFYADQPQSCSTPAISRVRNLRGRQARTNNFLPSFSWHDDSPRAGSPDVEMMDDHRRQTVHLSGNSIFSSSDEFTIRSLPATHDDRTTNRITNGNKMPARVSRQVSPHPEALDKPPVGHSLAGSFVAEYAVPLSDLDRFPPRSAIGERLLSLPGTSPAHGENLVIRTARNLGPRSSVGEKLLGLPGTSPAGGVNLVIRASRHLTPPPSPPDTNVPCSPSSPALDLTMKLQSIGICGDPDTRSDGRVEMHSPSASKNVPAERHAKKSVKRQPVRNRAGTIRASDFTKSGIHSGVASGTALPPPSNVRRTRSGTVVGPGAKGGGLPTEPAKSAPTTKLPAVPSGSESESDDELLLKDFWVEGLEYLGRPVPQGVTEAEADELNLGGPWCGSEAGPPRRLGLRRR